METQIAIKPDLLEEAITTVIKEHNQLSEDRSRQLKIVKGEIAESVNDSEFTYGFMVVADALVRKTDNILRELKNYSDAIAISNEELTKTNDDALRAVLDARSFLRKPLDKDTFFGH